MKKILCALLVIISVASYSQRGCGAIMAAGRVDYTAKEWYEFFGGYSTTQKAAINIFCKNKKGFGLWNKDSGIYVFMGGEAAAHSFNLKNRSVDQIAWGGSPTHNSNGVTGNGTSSYGNVFNINRMNTASNHTSFYSKTNNTGAAQVIGGTQQVPGSVVYYYPSLSSTSAYVAIGSFENGAASGTTTDSKSLYTFTATSTNARAVYKRDVLIGSSTTTETASFQTSGSSTFSILAFRQNIFFSNINFSYFDWGGGYNATDAANQYFTVQRLQTILGRQE